MPTLRIVEWKNPRQMYRGTKLVEEVQWTAKQHPSKGDTFVLKGLNYTVLNVDFNLDTDAVTITAMLTENVNGSGEEDL